MAIDKLAGKVVVVIGASHGYGLAASRQLVKAGASVVMATRHGAEDEIASVSDALGNSVALIADVRDPVSVRAVAARALEQFGRIDAWVNSATIAALGRFIDTSLESQVEVIHTNLVGTLYGSHVAIEQFRTQATGGVLINIAADPDSLNMPYMASYAAAKSGVVGLGASLQAEAKAEKWENIHVCTVMPGDFAEVDPSHTAATGTTAPPKAQTAVLDETADAIVELVASPKDTVKIHGSHYFL